MSLRSTSPCCHVDVDDIALDDRSGRFGEHPLTPRFSPIDAQNFPLSSFLGDFHALSSSELPTTEIWQFRLGL